VRLLQDLNIIRGNTDELNREPFGHPRDLERARWPADDLAATSVASSGPMPAAARTPRSPTSSSASLVTPSRRHRGAAAGSHTRAQIPRSAAIVGIPQRQRLRHFHHRHLLHHDQSSLDVHLSIVRDWPVSARAGAAGPERQGTYCTRNARPLARLHPGASRNLLAPRNVARSASPSGSRMEEAVLRPGRPTSAVGIFVAVDGSPLTPIQEALRLDRALTSPGPTSAGRFAPRQSESPKERINAAVYKYPFFRPN